MRIDRIERSDDGTINYAGLLLIINLLEKAGLDRVAERHSGGSFAKISNFEILAAYFKGQKPDLEWLTEEAGNA
ncbi:MAG TPA: hypothetical protein ENG14_02025 [Thermodesulforhabdus norvegica]|uniref:Uncharacterized protein n=1 Tax=Thermodesulforhabdus norvegica TaxID=39841 RepID=A0A7C1AXZ0_9BACT|nr:hypothetical protein [Thermodesulforhabdus norvegica]